MGGVVVDNGVTPGHARVGKREDNDNYFPGLVDEALIYDRVLSAAEIAQLADERPGTRRSKAVWIGTEESGRGLSWDGPRSCTFGTLRSRKVLWGWT
jgi:Concanavalin A-like lectin/glucanases superfamily